MPLPTALTDLCFALPVIPHNHRASLVLLHRRYYVYHGKVEMLMCRFNVKQRLEAVLKRIEFTFGHRHRHPGLLLATSQHWSLTFWSSVDPRKLHMPIHTQVWSVCVADHDLSQAVKPKKKTLWIKLFFLPLILDLNLKHYLTRGSCNIG